MLGLEMVEINQTLWGFSLPVWTPFFEILTGQLLKNQPAKNIISRWLIKIIRRAHIILSIAVLERHIQLHWLAITLDSKRNHIAGVRMGRQQICELDFAVERVHIV